MRSLLLFLSMLLLILGGGFGFKSQCQGQVVGFAEVEHAMGSGGGGTCYDLGTTAYWVCYGGTCLDGGCGCKKSYVSTGSHKLALPESCGTSDCTAPMDVTTQSCS